jgi:ribosomal protein S18 acetylase RimI-like enzyme
VTPSTPALRPAAPADAERLAALVDAAYGHYVPRIGDKPMPMTLDYQEVIRDYDVTVAEVGGEIAGLLALGTDEEGFMVYNVAVDPEHQGAGIGRVLLELAESRARDAGYESIYLFTHEKMTENRALYERIGYVEYDVREFGDARVIFLRKQLP